MTPPRLARRSGTWRGRECVVGFCCLAASMPVWLYRALPSSEFVSEPLGLQSRANASTGTFETGTFQTFTTQARSSRTNGDGMAALCCKPCEYLGKCIDKVGPAQACRDVSLVCAPALF